MDIEINRKAPDFEAEDSKGNIFRLSEHQGKNVLLVLNRGFA